MSDHYPAAHHRRKAVHVVGTTRKKSFVRASLVLVLLLAAVATYAIVTSGVFSDDNSPMIQELLNRINGQRQVAGLPPVHWDESLAKTAGQDSLQLRETPLAYNPAMNAKTEGVADAFTLPKTSQVLSALYIEPPLFDQWSASKQFAGHVMDKSLTSIGVGIETDGYNYYTVAVWK